MVTSKDVPAGVIDPASDVSAAVELSDVWRTFKKRPALRGVDLDVEPGEIRALLGPNGAGKTTLVRILSGVVDPDRGAIRLFGLPRDRLPHRVATKLIGLAPSADRSFYLRISALENLVFFARLYGLRKRAAVRRAMECLEVVGLADDARISVNVYSAGMQKRLAVARALLMEPPILLLDEATHDLDPAGARTVQELVAAERDRGAAVVWTTQRLDEIRDFADSVTLLDRGVVRFSGSVPELLARSFTRSYLLDLRSPPGGGEDLSLTLTPLLAPVARIWQHTGSAEGHYGLFLADGVTLGDALRRIMDQGIDVVSCRERRSQVEEAFLRLTGGGDEG
jgi:ABC-2 type transport system ATP-binding protein